MNVNNVVKFKSAVKKAHAFADGIPSTGQNSVSKQAILDHSDLSPTEVHVVALELQEDDQLKIVEDNTDVYLLNDKFYK